MRITPHLQRTVGIVAFILGLSGSAMCQTGASDLRVFGYFQPQFIHQNGPERDGVYNSFSIQQLNVFLQKDLGTDLSSFVNFEAVNTFSTRDGWGSLRIEEAWVRYRRSNSLSIKAGLSIPVFNSFNEIKNRTPLIPYVVRPLVYESSLSAVLNNPLYTPQQAFLQAYGWTSLGKNWKFDYATYLGNTDMVVASFTEGVPDVNRDIDLATGIDSSAAVLFGWRIGVRKGSFKFGFSATLDRTNLFAGADQIPDAPPGDYGSIPRYRSGYDLSFHIGRFWLENESLGVIATRKDEGLDAEVGFTYLMLGYDFSERVRGYTGYQIINQRIEVFGPVEEVDIWAPTIGAAYTLENLITLKAQYLYVVVDIHDNPAFDPDPKFHFATVAVSVSF